MSEIDPYVRVLFLMNSPQLQPFEGHFRREELAERIAIGIENLLRENGGDDVTDNNLLADALINEMIDKEMLVEEEQRFAGRYLIYKHDKFKGFRNSELNSSDIAKTAQRIGSRFFQDTFLGYLGEREAELYIPNLGIAPASNRIVKFNHNQTIKLDNDIEDLIKQVDGLNQIDETPGFREIIVGQLKAGRELIRAGSFRLYLLELTLFSSLRFLVQRYENQLIGGLASALLNALARQIGL